MIEILMVLAIMSIAFGTIYKSFEQLNRSYTKENVKAGIQQGARIAVDFMVQDIRMAGLDPLGTANALPLPVTDVMPEDMLIEENPPLIGFTVAPEAA